MSDDQLFTLTNREQHQKDISSELNSIFREKNFGHHLNHEVSIDDSFLSLFADDNMSFPSHSMQKAHEAENLQYAIQRQQDHNFQSKQTVTNAMLYGNTQQRTKSSRSSSRQPSKQSSQSSSNNQCKEIFKKLADLSSKKNELLLILSEKVKYYNHLRNQMLGIITNVWHKKYKFQWEDGENSNKENQSTAQKVLSSKEINNEYIQVMEELQVLISKIETNIENINKEIERIILQNLDKLLDDKEQNKSKVKDIFQLVLAIKNSETEVLQSRLTDKENMIKKSYRLIFQVHSFLRSQDSKQKQGKLSREKLIKDLEEQNNNYRATVSNQSKVIEELQKKVVDFLHKEQQQYQLPPKILTQQKPTRIKTEGDNDYGSVTVTQIPTDTQDQIDCLKGQFDTYYNNIMRRLQKPAKRSSSASGKRSKSPRISSCSTANYDSPKNPFENATQTLNKEMAQVIRENQNLMNRVNSLKIKVDNQKQDDINYESRIRYSSRY